MNLEIKREAQERGIARLCHFTQSRNWVHITTGASGVLATARLRAQDGAIFTPTDPLRLDGHDAFISCSIQYPNAWYFEKARSRDPVFTDWVILLIHPKYLWLDGTEFCSQNAAARGGAEVCRGAKAFRSLFADSVHGGSGRIFPRVPKHLPCCPTNDQAEVLIRDSIALADITGVIVASSTQAKNELSRYRLLRIPEDRFELIVAPVLFDKRALSDSIRLGQKPPEELWTSTEPQ